MFKIVLKECKHFRKVILSQKLDKQAFLPRVDDNYNYFYSLVKVDYMAQDGEDCYFKWIKDL